MDKDLQMSILSAFPNSKFVGIKREYKSGFTGAPVLAVQFRPDNNYGLNGTFIVKIGLEAWAKKEAALYTNLARSALVSLLASFHMPSFPVNGYAAVAYDVAFDSLLAPQPLLTLLEEGNPSDEKVQKQIEGLSQA